MSLSRDTQYPALSCRITGEDCLTAQDDTLLRWADGFAFAPDGTMYIVANQLHTHPALNMGKDGSDHAYVILTTKP